MAAAPDTDVGLRLPVNSSWSIKKEREAMMPLVSHLTHLMTACIQYHGSTEEGLRMGEGTDIWGGGRLTLKEVIPFE